MKKNNVVIVVVLFAAIISMFLFGKLFSFSPVIIGFQKFEYPNSLVYVQKKAELQARPKFDTLVAPVERFHKLKFKKKPEFFIFRDSLSYKRLSPSLSRFCAIPTTRIFIAPWSLKEAAAGKISMEIYLKHELSHILIFQQSGFFRAFRYPKWLLEGIAVYSAGQIGTGWYPSRSETCNYIRQGNFMPPDDYKTLQASRTVLNVKNRAAFIYSEFACIIDYLIMTYGREKFQLYMERLFIDNHHCEVFKAIYGLEFDRFLVDFRKFCDQLQADSQLKK